MSQEDNIKFRLPKVNLLLAGLGMLIVIFGFILMTGPGSTFEAFEPDIYSTRRIVIAPLVSFFGFLFVIFALLFQPKKKK